MSIAVFVKECYRVQYGMVNLYILADSDQLICYIDSLQIMLFIKASGDQSDGAAIVKESQSIFI